MNGVKRIRAAPSPPAAPPFPKINDMVFVLKECAADYADRVPQIEHKINVVSTNLKLVPFLEGGLVHMKLELQKVKDRIQQINAVLEASCLNN